jgi:molybdenum cofactor biosynthesis enzyme
MHWKLKRIELVKLSVKRLVTMVVRAAAADGFQRLDHLTSKAVRKTYTAKGPVR